MYILVLIFANVKTAMDWLYMPITIAVFFLRINLNSRLVFTV